MKLSLGVAREIITPEVGCHLSGYHDKVFSTEVHDDLTAIVFAFQQGETKAMMISLTVCTLDAELFGNIRRDISNETGIPFENIVIAATHTHSGPVTRSSVGWGTVDTEYCENILIPQLHKAVKTAVNNMQSVKMGVAVGESLVGCNRREFNKNNNISLGQRLWGPFDPRMTVITFKNDKKETVANIISYGCHGTAAGTNTEISRDWSGVMCDRVEFLTGGITAFFNGAEGDVGPRLTNGKTVGFGNIKYAEELGSVAAQDAMRIYNQISGVSDVELTCVGSTVKIPLKGRMSLDEAKKVYDETADAINNIRLRKHTHAKMVIDSYETDFCPQEYREFPQTIIKLGTTAFASTTFELFSEIALRIDGYAEDCHVIALSNANASEGYFVTEGEIPNGGYEVGMFLTNHIQMYEDHADWHMIKETMKNLRKAGIESCIE